LIPPLDLGAGGLSFPSFPEGAKYNYASTASGGLNGRTFRIPAFMTSTTMNPTTLVRVTFTDAFEHRWVVLADPAKVAATGFTLPAVPGGAVDRTFSNGMSTGTRSTLLVQTIRLSATQAASPTMAYKDLVEANNTNADRLTDFTTAFSFIDYARPTLSWKTPGPGGTIMKGTNAVISVKSFKVGNMAANGDDGFVKITFTGGTGCTETQGQTETMAGSGDVNVMIPSTCTGTGITARAKLVDVNGADLNPPVTADQTITVN
jgi:hypothetical protein